MLSSRVVRPKKENLVAHANAECNPGMSSLHTPEVSAADVTEIDEHAMCALEKTVAETHRRCNPGLSSIQAPGIKLEPDVPEIDEHMVCAPDKPVTEFSKHAPE